MATNETLISIPGRLHSVASEGHVSGADEIYDDDNQMLQSDINEETISHMGNNDIHVTAEDKTEWTNKADTDGNYPELVAGNIVGEFNQEAEVSFRPSAGTVDIQSGYKVNYGGNLEGVKGNVVAWNQLVNTPTFSSTTYKTLGTFSSISGHKYLFIINTSRVAENYESNYDYQILLETQIGEAVYYWLQGQTKRNLFIQTFEVSENFKFSFIVYENFGSEVSGSINVIDLTLIYGAGNEPATPADFEADYLRWFGKPLAYEAYNAGELIPVKMAGLKTVGFNQWDEQWELGILSFADGSEQNADNRIRCKNFIPCMPNTLYYLNVPSVGNSYLFFYDSNKEYISRTDSSVFSGTFTTPINARYIRFFVYNLSYGTTYKNDICINLSHSGERNGEYEPYWSSLLPFGVTKVYGKLNGEGSIVQIAANGLKKADYAGTIYDEINLENCTADIRVSDTPATLGEGLYEPLATPLHYTDLVYRENGVDYPLDGPLPYKVDDYGTEEVVAISGQRTVAPVLDLRYGINVGDTIRNLPFNYLSPKMQQTFTEAEQRQARKNIGVDITRADVPALIRSIGHIEFVDMGLPSGRMWASKNLGAETITDHGYYFSWGNVIGHAEGSGYDFSDAVYADTEGAALTADITINNDAANFYLGGTCKMPTVADFQELNNNCDSEWVTLHGVAGRRFTSRINGNSIFFPASGYYDGTSLNYHGSNGYYWSSSYLSATGAYLLNFNSSNVYPAINYKRRRGHSVRAVL